MRRIHAAKRKLFRKFFQFLRALFYRFVFGRQIPFAAGFEKVITYYEKRQGKSDIPVSADTWETQYLGDKWAYMKQLEELARYSIIVGYIAYLKPGGAVLDVGCGEGILFDRYRPYGYSKYLGIDISEAALAKLAEQQSENTIFIRADAEAYRPTELFDVIIFNEALYYLHEPLTVVKRYSLALKKGGILIISTYTASPRAMAILREIKAKYSLLDETQTTHWSLSWSWVCTVLAPHKQDQ